MRFQSGYFFFKSQGGGDFSPPKDSDRVWADQVPTSIHQIFAQLYLWSVGYEKPFDRIFCALPVLYLKVRPYQGFTIIYMGSQYRCS